MNLPITLKRRLSPADPRALLGVLILVAFAIRAWKPDFAQGYHPDERHIMFVVGKLSLDDLNPHSFAYGSFPFYILWLVSSVAGKFSGFLSSYDGHFLLGRLLSAAFGALCVGATFGLARSMGAGRRSALVAAALVAFNAFHIQNSRFYTVDGLLTLLATVSLVVALRLAEAPTRRLGFLAGVVLGLAVATKVSALSLVLPLVAAWALSLDRGGRIAHLGLAAAGALTALIVFQPYAFLDYATFSAHVREQMRMVSGAWVPPYTNQYVDTPPFFYPLKQMFRYTLGVPVTAAAIAGLLVALARRPGAMRRQDAVVLSWVIPMFVYVGGLQVKFPRYLLPIYPVLCCYAASILAACYHALRGRVSETWATAPASLVVAWSAIGAAAFLSLFNERHVWETASIWFHKNVPVGAKVLGEHWDDRLPLTLPGYETARRYQVAGRQLELPVYEQDSAGKMRIIAERLAAGDVLALPTARGYGALSRLPRKFPLTSRYYQLLFAGELGYRLEKTFAPTPAFGPFRFPDELSDESLTVYDHPKVCIFFNRDRLSADEIYRKLTSPGAPGARATWAEIMTAREMPVPRSKPSAAPESKGLSVTTRSESR